MKTTDRDELWALERDFWLAGADVFETRMAKECVMVFPWPVGILGHDGIVGGLRTAPRWTAVDLTQQRMAVPDAETVCLAYRADARRQGEDGYSALCGSTYVRRSDGWKLAAHQQTPLAKNGA
jgi:hypothetical protein